MESHTTHKPMYSEDQLLPISALQHLLFCERQCALIHVERLWVENRLTVEGQHLHRKTHDEGHSVNDGVTIARGLSIRSFREGIVGQADIVEFPPSSPPVPVEYKRGKPKKNDCDRVQLCAQAMCIEEMLETAIPQGFLFYGQRKRRTKVVFDDSLRQHTTTAIKRFREMVEYHETPSAKRQPKCDACSLLTVCLPDCMRFQKGTSEFIRRQLAAVLASEGPQTDDSESTL